MKDIHNDGHGEKVLPVRFSITMRMLGGLGVTRTVSFGLEFRTMDEVRMGNSMAESGMTVSYCQTTYATSSFFFLTLA